MAKCPYIMITNGLNHYVLILIRMKKIEFVDSIPFYSKEK